MRGAEAITLSVANTGDPPHFRWASHYHFAETNPGLQFDREAATGYRLDIAAGTAVRGLNPARPANVQSLLP